MKITVLLAALCAVVFAPNADARPAHPSLHKMQTSAGCSDPIMRPCDTGSESGIFGEEINRKSLRHRHFLPDPARKEITHHNTARAMPPGLSRVMAEGAGRAIGRRPRAWCGWWMRRHLGVANPAGNLARWWAGFGRPAHGPHVGAIVVWRHHVGRITGRTADGRWIVKSGNDGHRVRERPRSVADAIAFRWPA